VTVEFGDSEPDDAFDVETVLDPEQVARRLQELRREHGDTTKDWDDLTPQQQTMALAVMVALIAWMRREGAVR
jgi:hypothetical protein